MGYGWRSTLPDPRPKLTGAGTYGPLRIPWTRKHHLHLWTHVSTAPAGNTLLVYRDGTVFEGQQFPEEVFGDPDLYTFLEGGKDWRCPDLDPFVLQSLMAAGYSCCEDRLDIYHPQDQYSDDYPREGGCS